MKKVLTSILIFFLAFFITSCDEEIKLDIKVENCLSYTVDVENGTIDISVKDVLIYDLNNIKVPDAYTVEFFNANEDALSDLKVQLLVGINKFKATLTSKDSPDFKLEFDINIHKGNIYLANIEVESWTDRYYLNEEFKPGKLKLIYSDTSVSIIDLNENYVQNFDTSKPGEFVLTINYDNKTLKVPYTVSVKELNVLSIELIEEESNLIYYINDSKFVGKLKVIYEDNSEEIIDIEPNMYSMFKTDEKGDHKLEISFKGSKIEVDYSVIGIKEISIKSLDSSYHQNDEFKGGKLLVTYEDNNVKDINITTDMIKGFDTSAAGTYTLEIEYAGHTLTQEYEVIALKIIKLEAEAFISNYFLNDAFKSFRIKVTYNNSEIEYVDVTKDMVTGFDTSSYGNKELVVTYKEKTLKLPYTVVSLNAEIIKIEILNMDSVYELNSTFNGGKLKVYFNDQTTTLVDITIDMITGFDTSSLGKKELIITYKDFEVTFTYEVLESQDILDIEIYSLDNEYFIGDEFGKGLLRVTYTNGSYQIYDITKDMVTGFDTSTPGTKTIGINYKGKSITYNIIVKEDLDLPEKEEIDIELLTKLYKRYYAIYAELDDFTIEDIDNIKNDHFDKNMFKTVTEFFNRINITNSQLEEVIALYDEYQLHTFLKFSDMNQLLNIIKDETSYYKIVDFLNNLFNILSKDQVTQILYEVVDIMHDDIFYNSTRAQIKKIEEILKNTTDKELQDLLKDSIARLEDSIKYTDNKDITKLVDLVYSFVQVSLPLLSHDILLDIILIASEGIDFSKSSSELYKQFVSIRAVFILFNDLDLTFSKDILMLLYEIPSLIPYQTFNMMYMITDLLPYLNIIEPILFKFDTKHIEAIQYIMNNGVENPDNLDITKGHLDTLLELLKPLIKEINTNKDFKNALYVSIANITNFNPNSFNIYIDELIKLTQLETVTILDYQKLFNIFSQNQPSPALQFYLDNNNILLKKGISKDEAVDLIVKNSNPALIGYDNKSIYLTDSSIYYFDSLDKEGRFVGYILYDNIKYYFTYVVYENISNIFIEYQEYVTNDIYLNIYPKTEDLKIKLDVHKLVSTKVFAECIVYEYFIEGYVDFTLYLVCEIGNDGILNRDNLIRNGDDLFYWHNGVEIRLSYQDLLNLGFKQDIKGIQYINYEINKVIYKIPLIADNSNIKYKNFIFEFNDDLSLITFFTNEKIYISEENINKITFEKEVITYDQFLEMIIELLGTDDFEIYIQDTEVYFKTNDFNFSLLNYAKPNIDFEVKEKYVEVNSRTDLTTDLILDNFIFYVNGETYDTRKLYDLLKPYGNFYHIVEPSPVAFSVDTRYNGIKFYVYIKDEANLLVGIEPSMIDKNIKVEKFPETYEELIPFIASNINLTMFYTNKIDIISDISVITDILKNCTYMSSNGNDYSRDYSISISYKNIYFYINLTLVKEINVSLDIIDDTIIISDKDDLQTYLERYLKYYVRLISDTDNIKLSFNIINENEIQLFYYFNDEKIIFDETLRVIVSEYILHAENFLEFEDNQNIENEVELNLNNYVKLKDEYQKNELTYNINYDTNKIEIYLIINDNQELIYKIPFKILKHYNITFDGDFIEIPADVDVYEIIKNELTKRLHIEGINQEELFNYINFDLHENEGIIYIYSYDDSRLIYEIYFIFTGLVTIQTTKDIIEVPNDKEIDSYIKEFIINNITVDSISGQEVLNILSYKIINDRVIFNYNKFNVPVLVLKYEHEKNEINELKSDIDYVIINSSITDLDAYFKKYVEDHVYIDNNNLPENIWKAFLWRAYELKYDEEASILYVIYKETGNVALEYKVIIE